MCVCVCVWWRGGGGGINDFVSSRANRLCLHARLLGAWQNDMNAHIVLPGTNRYCQAHALEV